MTERVGEGEQGGGESEGGEPRPPSSGAPLGPKPPAEGVDRPWSMRSPPSLPPPAPQTPSDLPEPPRNRTSDAAPPRGNERGGRAVAATVFVSDPTVEAARVEWALRARGHRVFDVPLAMLAGRLGVQHADLVLVDGDAPGAAEVLARLRIAQPPAAPSGRARVAIAGHEAPAPALVAYDTFYRRPIDVESLLADLDRWVAGGHGASDNDRSTRMPRGSEPPPDEDAMPASGATAHLDRFGSQPPLSPRDDLDDAPASRMLGIATTDERPAASERPLSPSEGESSQPTGTDAVVGASSSGSTDARLHGSERPEAMGPRRSLPPGADDPLAPSIPPPSVSPMTASSPPSAPLPGHAGEQVGAGPSDRAAMRVTQTRLSPDLERLLRDAELRVAGPASQRLPESANAHDDVLSPEDEVEGVLPAEVLASLDLPLDIDLDDDDGSNSDTGSSTPKATTGRTARGAAGAGANEKTGPGRDRRRGTSPGSDDHDAADANERAEARAIAEAIAHRASDGMGGRAIGVAASGAAVEAVGSAAYDRHGFRAGEVSPIDDEVGERDDGPATTAGGRRGREDRARDDDLPLSIPVERDDRRDERNDRAPGRSSRPAGRYRSSGETGAPATGIGMGDNEDDGGRRAGSDVATPRPPRRASGLPAELESYRDELARSQSEISVVHGMPAPALDHPPPLAPQTARPLREDSKAPVTEGRPTLATSNAAVTARAIVSANAISIVNGPVAASRRSRGSPRRPAISRPRAEVSRSTTRRSIRHHGRRRPPFSTPTSGARRPPGKVGIASTPTAAATPRRAPPAPSATSTTRCAPSPPPSGRE